MSAIAIATLPVTEVVAQVLFAGLLEQRLALGLEEIYVSEYAGVALPAIREPLRDLARRYPERLMLVPAEPFIGQREPLRAALRVRSDSTLEFLALGDCLAGAYLDRHDQMPPEYRWRPGDIPAEIRDGPLVLRERIISLPDWKGLDLNDMARHLARHQTERLTQRARATARLRATLGKQT